MTVGEFVRKKRKEQKITQKQLALHAEVSFTFVNRLENGDLNIQLTPLNKVLRVFGHRVGAVPDRE